jgi:hypothetical protein
VILTRGRAPQKHVWTHYAVKAIAIVSMVISNGIELQLISRDASLRWRLKPDVLTNSVWLHHVHTNILARMEITRV